MAPALLVTGRCLAQRAPSSWLEKVCTPIHSELPVRPFSALSPAFGEVASSFDASFPLHSCERKQTVTCGTGRTTPSMLLACGAWALGSASSMLQPERR